MTDQAQMPRFSAADLPDDVSHDDVIANRFTELTLERHKREGMELAVRARFVALAVIAVMLPFLNPDWEVLYYEAALALLALNGWLQRRFGRVGVSRVELLLLFIDLALMVVLLSFPNPFANESWPSAMSYRFENFIYFYVVLTGATLMYSWRTIMAVGNWTAAMWLLALAANWWLGKEMPELNAAAEMAFGHDPEMLTLLNPNSLNIDIRVQEVVVFIICAATLALGVRRFNRLLLGNAALERERTNLSRYFSPNVVEQLSRNDEPLKAVREQDVAVVFVDIVGFTEYAAQRPATEVIATLRAFHERMERCVFAHGGTLDKYLGDGLMATFGTPFVSGQDATSALRCARAMLAAADEWSDARVARNEPVLRVSIGLHFGPVVLGDIGANRLEFAVIGNTVNVASRIEALSRPLKARLVLSDAMRMRVAEEAGDNDPLLANLQRVEGQRLKGLEAAVTVWSLG